MPLNDAIREVRLRAEALWEDIEPSVPLTFRNRNFTPPISNNMPAPFVRIEVLWSAGGFESIGAPGNNLARRMGHIWIYAFTMKGIGDERANELVAKAASMFEGEDFGGIVCEAMMAGGEASDENGLYFGQSVAIPFDFDEEV